MKSDLFLNKGTRLVAITMNLYNTNTRYLTSIRFTFQFFSNGHIVKNYRFYSVRIVLYESFTDQVSSADRMFSCAAHYQHVFPYLF